MLQEENTPPDGFVNQAFSAEENGTVATISPSSHTLTNTIQKFSPTPPLPLSPHEDEGGGCGWLSFKPKFLQRFRTSKWVLVGLIWAAITQGMVINGFVNVCISTIEKRYHLKSASTGLIAGCYDMGAVICSIPVSYLGSLPGASKPRWLGWGILIMGIGSFVFVLPHFTSPPYDLNQSSEGGISTTSVVLCLQQDNRSSSCQNISKERLSSYKYVFLLGQFLHGVGASPLYTLGTAYLDESVPMKMSSFYLGIFHAMAVIGPAAGYVIGGQLLNVYIDAPNIDPKSFGITKESDQWLGAWWIGFVISGTLAVSMSWILMAFPSEIPGSKKRASERTGAVEYTDAKAFAHIRHLPEAAKVLMRNLPFVFLSLAQAFDGALISGFATFMPKVIESQFGMTAAFAALLVGSIAVPAGGGGTFFGGWLVKLMKLKCAEILKFCFILSSVCFCFTFAFIISCPEASLAGVNVAYDDRSMSPLPSFGASCNQNCECQDVSYDPVCGTNKIMYYSPCHAGCHSKINLGEHQIYSDCACIKSLPLRNGSDPLQLKSEGKTLLMPPNAVSRQKCPSQCPYLAPFLIMFFIVMLITFLISMPSMTGTLRCVPDTHRSLALGLQGIQIRLLGTIPGPIIFGVVMDSTCTLWQTTCKGAGSCRHYNNALMSGSLAGVSLFFKALCMLAFFLSWWFYRRKTKGNIVTVETSNCSNGAVVQNEQNHISRHSISVSHS